MNILFLTSSAPLKAGFSTSEKRPPLGLATLIAVAKNAGHLTYFSDEYLMPTDILNGDFLQRNDIDYVGIYANTICYQSTLNMLNVLHQKRNDRVWKGKIVVGGPHTSIGLDTIPDYVDHIVVGEGEISLLKILSGEISDRVIQGERVQDLDSLPFPAWEELIYRNYDWNFPFDQQKNTPCYTMNTSRGCPFNCTFCSVGAVWGRSYRFMSAERIVADIEKLIQYYGAKSIYFREDHFTLNKGRVEEFCRVLMNRRIEIDWACETRVDSLDDYDYQKLMADAGCKMFYIGVESGSPRMLKWFNKGETVEQFETAFEIARRVGIKTFASFVVEAPTETQEDRDQTDEFIRKIKPDHVSRNIYVGIPGSELYDYVLDHQEYEYMDPFGVAYLKGYLKSVDHYYGGNPYFKVYGSEQTKLTWRAIRTCVLDMSLRKIIRRLRQIVR